MTFRQGNREQMQFLPPSIEQYVLEDAPVRVYDAFGDTLDLKQLGIQYEPNREGNPAYDPRTMLKLLIYAYSYGVRASRKIERETYYNLSFMWLMGGLKPDYKTISEFRRKHKEALSEALKQCARLCLKLNLIDGNILFLDGSKIRGNSALKNSWNEKKCQKILAATEKRIDEIIRVAEAEDAAEEGEPSLVSLPTQLLEPNRTKEKVNHIMEELKQSGKSSLNTVDKENTSFNGIHGPGAGYNAQIITDDKHGLIVTGDAVSAGNDLGQMSGQFKQAQEVLAKKPAVGVADAGFSDMADLRLLVEQGIRVIVPSKQQVNDKKIGEFDKRNFQYLSDGDCYICPEGHRLRFVQVIEKSGNRLYTIRKKTDCLNCPQYGKCTKSKSGRKLERLVEEDLRIKLEQAYILPENRMIYKRRQAKAELVFGHFKKNLGVTCFLLRGNAGARAEVGLLSICFNVRRMITILGQKVLIQVLKALARGDQASLAAIMLINNSFSALLTVFLTPSSIFIYFERPVFCRAGSFTNS
jgi:transposase